MSLTSTDTTTDPPVRPTARWPGILFALGFPSVLTWTYFVALADLAAAIQQTTYAVGKIVQFGFPLVWVYLVIGRRLRPARPGSRGIPAGLVFGTFVLLAMMALYHGWLKPAGLFENLETGVRQKVIGLGLDSWWKYAAVGVFYALAHSFLEEYYWRWFVYRQLRQLLTSGLAVLISSLGFMAHHVILLATYFGWDSPATYGFSLTVAVGGAVWAVLYERSGSLVGPWLSHLLVDAGIFLIGYDLVRDSLT